MFRQMLNSDVYEPAAIGSKTVLHIYVQRMMC